jgi:uncharacterized protein (UPF0332 family)
MNTNREQQAHVNFTKYVKDSLLKKEKTNPRILERLEQNAIESLEVANNLFSNKTSFLWTIVTSYYAMFYIASAYVYQKGYKAQHQIVHKVINDALIVLSQKELQEKYLKIYEEEKEKALALSQQLLENLEFERIKRSTFQYEMDAELKISKAQTSLNRAKEFVSIFRELMDT